jgi:exopolysaccharide production protein ExoQ
LNTTWQTKIGKYGFIILLFFTICGTSIPFQKAEVSTESTSSAFNQVLYSGLFLFSLISLTSRKNDVYNIIKEEKFLTLFIVFAFASMLWSDYSFTTFKRIFQVFAVFLTCIAFLINVDSAEEIIKPFKYILYPYMILTFLSILAIPMARGADGMWRGMTGFKNELGQIGVMSVVLCYIFYLMETSSRKKTFALFMILLSTVITIGTKSSTSTLGIAFLIGLGGLVFVDKIFAPIGIGRTISSVALALFLMLFVGIMVLAPDLSTAVPELFGKDASFSGRSDLWEYLLSERNINNILGSGYEAFWIPESHRILSMWEVFTWIPLQAHNGYIDLYLSTGYVGLGIIIIMVIWYFFNYFKIQKPHPWVLFILVTLIFNIQESSLFRIGQRLNFIFIFAYLLLFVTNHKDFIWSAKLRQNNY